jgi:hypothetical protein
MTAADSSTLTELQPVEDLIAEAAAADANNYVGGRMMLAGLQQRRGRLLTAYLDAHMTTALDLLDFGITRAATQGTGAEIGLLSKVLAPFQDSLASIAQSIMGRPTTRGQLPGTIQDSVALKVAVALPGSLHLRLVPVVPESQQGLFEDDKSLLEASLEVLCGLIQSEAGQNDTFQSIASAGPRAASHLHALSKALAENHANLDLRWRSPRTTLNARLDSQRAAELRQLFEDVTDETRTLVFRGRIVGANLIRKTFDLQLGETEQDGSVISGKVADDALSAVEEHFGVACTATIEVRESSLKSGETKEHFTLMQLVG